jgi:hypothetical protein
MLLGRRPNTGAVETRTKGVDCRRPTPLTDQLKSAPDRRRVKRSDGNELASQHIGLEGPASGVLKPSPQPAGPVTAPMRRLGAVEEKPPLKCRCFTAE